jgi:hypothetical protein
MVRTPAGVFGRQSSQICWHARRCEPSSVPTFMKVVRGAVGTAWSHVDAYRVCSPANYSATVAIPLAASCLPLLGSNSAS